MTLHDGSEREVHVYEAYWAPLTEGKVTLRDVVGFFIRGGLTGAAWGTQPFHRWLFGQFVVFPAPVRTVLYLVTALAVVVALWFLSVLIVTIAAARLSLQTPPTWLSDRLFADMTTVLNALVCAFAAFAVCLVAARLLRRVPYVNAAAGALTIGTFALALWAAMAAAISAALVMSYHVMVATPDGGSLFEVVGWSRAVDSLNGAVDSWLFASLIGCLVAPAFWWLGRIGRETVRSLADGRSRSLTAAVFITFVAIFGLLAALAWRLSGPVVSGLDAYHWRRSLAWPLVLVAAAGVRHVLIQYVGDVAAYVQPQVLDRFADLRRQIKDCVWRAVRAVYCEPAYEDVILVGHSLGSVVLYDVLNRLLIDRTVGTLDAPEVAARTRLLLTVGSPLDKTAFVFGVMSQRSEAREALSAAVQPLIAEQAIRPPWLNIYSRWDLISGSLDYYDLPDRSNRRPVENRRDPDAGLLLVAHVEYWNNALLFDTLLEHLA